MEYHTAGVDTTNTTHMASHVQHFQPPPQNPASSSSSSTTYPSQPYRPAIPVHQSNHHHPTNAQHDVPQNYYAEQRRPTLTPSTPSQTASPRYSTLSPSQQPRQLYQTPPLPVADRNLPNPDTITPETIGTAYASFILFCNPSFPLTTSTEELKRVFSQPPRSEGKSFDTYRLYELISKLERKDIKTWTELALELGVEKADLDKGQSSQKVGQYTVRLKRWMKALHIDAFFDYLNDKNPPYLKQVPNPSDPLPEHRDGVPIEEDLAIRALDPKFRPKRGRRKADEMQDEDMIEPQSAIEPKRPLLDTSFGGRHGTGGYPHSAYPGGMSAHPDSMPHDPWAAATASLTSSRFGDSSRWRTSDPQTPHPLSAIQPMSAHPDSAYDNEPQSAVTPRARSRRRHGPAVSSAWPSSGIPGSGRLRGRPPANRSVRDGPFVTFPVDPGKERDGGIVDISRGPAASSASNTSETQASETIRPPPPPAPASAHPVAHPTATLPPPVRPATQAPPGRPDRLQLQVPVHTGNPVQLVTPTLLVNGALSTGPPRPPVFTQTATPATTASLLTASSMHSRYGLGSNFGSYDGKDTGHDEETPFLTPRSGIGRPNSMIGTPVSVASRSARERSAEEQREAPPPPPRSRLAIESLKRLLAADLLRGEVIGRRGKKNRLRGVEAKLLAEAMLTRMHGRFALSSPSMDSGHYPPASAIGASSTPTTTTEEEHHRNTTAASWLGLSLPYPLSAFSNPPADNNNNNATTSAENIFAPAQTESTKRIVIHRFRIGRDGYDSPLPSDDEDAPVLGSTDASPPRRDGLLDRDRDAEVRETFDVEWTASLGGVSGRFAIRGLSIATAGGAGGGQGQGHGQHSYSNSTSGAGMEHLISAGAGTGPGGSGLASISEEGNGPAERRPFFLPPGGQLVGPSFSTTGAPGGGGAVDKEREILMWRERALEAERQVGRAREEVGRLREGVLDVVL